MIAGFFIWNILQTNVFAKSVKIFLTGDIIELNIILKGSVQTLKNYITRGITLLIALQLLNLSIYSQDFNPIYSGAGTEETNITETIVEYVVEVVLGHTNAIPEQTQHHKDLHFHKQLSFKAISFERNDELTQVQIHISKLPVLLRESYQDEYFQEIHPKPPKA